MDVHAYTHIHTRACKQFFLLAHGCEKKSACTYPTCCDLLLPHSRPQRSTTPPTATTTPPTALNHHPAHRAKPPPRPPPPLAVQVPDFAALRRPNLKSR